MSSPNIDGKAILNTVYHGAVLSVLTIGTAKLIKMLFKRATLPNLDADVYDTGMLALDISVALAIRDLLVRSGLPDNIIK